MKLSNDRNHINFLPHQCLSNMHILRELTPLCDAYMVKVKVIDAHMATMKSIMIHINKKNEARCVINANMARIKSIYYGITTRKRRFNNV